MNIKALAASALVATTALMGGIAPAEAASLRDQAIVVVDHYAAQSNREFEAEDWTAFCRSEGTQFYVDAMYGMSSTLGRGYKAQTENNIRICKEEGYSVSPWPRAQWPIDIRLRALAPGPLLMMPPLAPTSPAPTTAARLPPL